MKQCHEPDQPKERHYEPLRYCDRSLDRVTTYGGKEVYYETCKKYAPEPKMGPFTQQHFVH